MADVTSLAHVRLDRLLDDPARAQVGALNFLVSLIQVFLTVYIVHCALAGKAD